MNKLYSRVALVLLVAGLVGCSNQYPGLFSSGQTVGVAGEERGLSATSVDRQGNESRTNITMTGGGDVSLQTMDRDDKRKMSRALDAGTGKPTHWENGATGIGYTVTPIRKVTVQGNPFCREYSVQATRGGNTKNMGGTACVTSDGTWHSI